MDITTTKEWGGLIERDLMGTLFHQIAVQRGRLEISLLYNSRCQEIS
jgi:hypothetical protein